MHCSHFLSQYILVTVFPIAIATRCEIPYTDTEVFYNQKLVCNEKIDDRYNAIDSCARSWTRRRKLYYATFYFNSWLHVSIRRSFCIPTDLAGDFRHLHCWRQEEDVARSQHIVATSSLASRPQVPGEMSAALWIRPAINNGILAFACACCLSIDESMSQRAFTGRLSRAKRFDLFEAFLRNVGLDRFSFVRLLTQSSLKWRIYFALFGD